MLVLSRHRDESIMIGDNIVLTIVDIRGDKVRLGIDAPQNIPVHRQEVYDAIRRENRQAASTCGNAMQEVALYFLFKCLILTNEVFVST